MIAQLITLDKALELAQGKACDFLAGTRPRLSGGGAACRPPGRCEQRPSTPHSQIQTDSRSKIQDEDEIEDEDDLVAATPR